MTQQDDWRPEMARLAQRQDQLERQQRDSTRRWKPCGETAMP